MNDMWQAWLVARREMRERSRSRAFQASVVFLIVGVAAMLILYRSNIELPSLSWGYAAW